MGACCSSEHPPPKQGSHGRRRRKDAHRSGKHVARRSGGAPVPGGVPNAAAPAGTAGTPLPHHHGRPPPLLVAGSVVSGGAHHGERVGVAHARPQVKGLLTRTASPAAGEDDYHSCREDFSVECERQGAGRWISPCVQLHNAVYLAAMMPAFALTTLHGHRQARRVTQLMARHRARLGCPDQATAWAVHSAPSQHISPVLHHRPMADTRTRSQLQRKHQGLAQSMGQMRMRTARASRRAPVRLWAA